MTDCLSIEFPDDKRIKIIMQILEQYKVDDYVQSYRNYYIGDKKRFATWKNRDIPSWFK